MAGKARSRSKTSRSRSSKKPARARPSRFVSLLQGIVTTIILVGAGILIGSFFGQWRTTLPDDISFESAERPLNDRIQVEVLNGVGESGLARRFTRDLRDLGFDVVAVGNAEHFDHSSTHVLDRSGRTGAAREVADGLGTDSVVVALDPDLYLDATVVIGRDWRGVLGALNRE